MTTMLRALVAVLPPLSATRTVKLEVPNAVGVPVSAPAALSVRPAGKDPALTLHAFPPLPPLAANVCEYAVPTVASGSEAVVTVRGGGSTTMLRTLVALLPPLSATRTVKLEVPTAVGVPVIAPPALSVRPAGSTPAIRDQVFPPLPPAAESVCE